jgi:hypothetical protein
MKKKLPNYRHGDIGFFGIKELLEGLTASRSRTIFVRSGGNAHTFSGGTFYPRIDGQFIIGYLMAKNTTLYHKRHGKKVKCKVLREAKIPDMVYEVRRQVEDTHSGMKPVID